jgi:hypothetical protein
MKLPDNVKKAASAIVTGIMTFWAIQEIAKNYGVALTLPSPAAHQQLALAFLALTAFPLWLGYQIHAWRTKKSERLKRVEQIRADVLRAMADFKLWGVPRLLEIVKNGGEIKVIGADYSRWAETYYEDIVNCVKEKGIKFTFLAPDPARMDDPDSNLKRAINAELVQQGEIGNLEGSLDTFRKMRSKLGEDKVHVRLFDLPLSHSMAIAVPSVGKDAEVHLWPYLHTVHGDQRPYKTYENSNPEHAAKFQKCLESYQYVFERSVEDKKGTGRGLSDLLRLVYAPLYSAVLEMKEGKDTLPFTNLAVGNRNNPWNNNPKIIQQVVDVFERYSALIENAEVLKGWNENKEDLRGHKFTYGIDQRKWLESIEKEYRRIRSSV